MSKDYFHALVHPAAYNPEAKAAFHNAAKTLLKRLAKRLDQTGGPDPLSGYGQRDPVRSNQGGVAVSGEITLHYDRLYVQVSQPAFGTVSTGILYRSCVSRKDYCGGQNHFAPIDYLLETEKLARLIESHVTFTLLMGHGKA